MSDIQDLEALYSAFDKEPSLSSTMKTLVSELLTATETLDHALINPFDSFYNDVIGCLVKFDFQQALGATIYADATGDATACIHIATDVRAIKPELIFNWISSALKTIDHVVLHCIQECLKEALKTYNGYGDENARYKQLEEQPDPLGTSGTYLNSIYGLRNKNEHRTQLVNGKVVLKKPNMSKAKKDSILYFERALKGILQAYKTSYPQYIQA